jgi:serine/threonine-protein phosphatase PGAM5
MNRRSSRLTFQASALYALLLTLPAVLAAQQPSAAGPPPTPVPGAETAAPEPAGTHTLVLVRHGAYDTEDTTDDAVGRHLVPIGVAQARLTGARLRALPFRFDEVLASPLTRARETAAVIADDLGMPVRIVPDLAECTPPTRRQDVMAEGTTEDLAACTSQLERAATMLLQPVTADRRDLVVAHGNVIRWLVTRTLGVDVDAWLGMSVGHASLTVLVVEPGGRLRVVAVGDVGHLPPNLRTGSIADVDRDLEVPGKP